LTGLRLSDFEALHEPFAKAWNTYFSNYTLEGKARLRRVSLRKNSIFTNTEEALFFALVYFKGNVLQEELAAQFGIDQPKASKYLFLIRQLLTQTVKENTKVLPKPKLERLKQSISAYPIA
jgi:Helix-turn-helix of DDE superfamily endonuclease